MDGYDVANRDKECGGCFAAGINFGASLISLFYGGGDYKETIKIATLCGWDSDNPASTWGGLLGFMYGKKKIVELFKVEMSNSYNIHRTRINFKIMEWIILIIWLISQFKFLKKLLMKNLTGL